MKALDANAAMVAIPKADKLKRIFLEFIFLYWLNVIGFNPYGIEQAYMFL